MKKFVLFIPYEINSIYLEEFVQNNLGMDFLSDGCNSVEYVSDKTPRDFKKKMLKNFGSVTLQHLRFKKMNNFDEDIDYED